MKYAIIGCGRISPNHFEAAHKNNLTIVAVSDIVPERMTEKVLQFCPNDETKLYEDYKILLSEIKPELVAICTDSGSHGEIALACLEAGANIIIEKPIAMSLAEADAIIAKAKEKGLKVCSCHQNRFNKSIRKIREAVEQGRFGRLLHGAAHVRWNRNEDYYKQAPWRGTWSMDGGCLMNQCIHNIDLLRWMMGGEIDEVFAYTDQLNHDYIEAEDLGLAVIKFKNGSYGLLEGTTNVYPKNLEETLYIFGSEGTVKAGGKSVNKLEEWSFSDGLDNSDEVKEQYHEDPPNVYGFGHTPLYADVISAIREDKEVYVSGEDGRAALELVLAIYKSAATGRAVKFPLYELKSTDFRGRFDVC